MKLFFPRRQTNFISGMVCQISGTQVHGDRLADALYGACGLRVEITGKLVTVYRLAHAFQVSDDRVQHLGLKNEAELRIHVIHDLLPALLWITHGP